MEGMTLTVAVRLLEENVSSKQVEDHVILSFLEYLDAASDVLLRVCMHDTTANASAVYLNAQRGGVVDGSQLTDDTALLCVE